MRSQVLHLTDKKTEKSLKKLNDIPKAHSKISRNVGPGTRNLMTL